jgi:hypothetical protein
MGSAALREGKQSKAMVYENDALFAFLLERGGTGHLCSFIDISVV